MNLKKISPEVSSQSTEILESLIRLNAERGSLQRWEQQIRSQLRHAKEWPSSEADMLNDWFHACTCVSLQIIDGIGLGFTQVEPACYVHMEGAWLDQLKELKAYYIWEKNKSRSNEENYSAAGGCIRNLLLSRARATTSEFEAVRTYIESRYLRDGNARKLDDRKSGTHALIQRKAYRIWEKTGGLSKTNWFRAKRYASMFYENILGAVVDDDEEKTKNVLRAFEFTKEPANKYLIINAFEAATAIYYLNKDVVKKILKDPSQYDFSFEPTSTWPHPGGDGLQYDSDAGLLVYAGVMSENEKAMLVGTACSETDRTTIERLFQETQLRPYQDQLL